MTSETGIGHSSSRGHQGKKWVLLAAGSKGWVDYRHQANVCHAYQMVHRNGIPDEQVVVMMYDDIANNAQNPHKGVIINEPDGLNVYTGVPKDYTGQDVTASNFLAVLRGDRAAVGNKKVLKSEKDDTIFIFLSGHGGPGIFAFPGHYLHACDLLETINGMAEAQQFSKMVIYNESCYSGSMIEHLPQNIQVYGVSASKSNERSYGFWLDEQRNTCLACVFSAFWLENCEKTKLATTNFQDQFQFVVEKIGALNWEGYEKSNPWQHGNIHDLRLLVLSVFLRRV